MRCEMIAAAILSSAFAGADALAPQDGVENVDYGVFEVSRLRCVIGNNCSLGQHKRRYNGIFHMTAPEQSETLFVPDYAGFNLEHYFDARPRHPDGKIVFEPREAPMQFQRINATTAELRQPPTPYFGVESVTRFELREPYYIDVTYRCIPRKDDLVGQFFGVFWASYINDPDDKSIYFLAAGSTLDKPQWVQLCTQRHDRDSTVLQEKDPGQVTFQEGPTMLWNQISPLRYSEPFYYGRFRNMVLIYMFEPNPNIRFSHSPSGGGPNAAEDTTNPAWDFQLIAPNHQVGQEYTLRARVAYKPWVNRADVIDEVRRFQAEKNKR